MTCHCGAPSPVGLHTLGQAAAHCGVGRNLFRRWLAAGTGPRPYRMAPKCTPRWSGLELDRWLADTEAAA